MEARCRRETSDEEQGQREKKKKRVSEVFFPPSTRVEKNPLQLKKKKNSTPPRSRAFLIEQSYSLFLALCCPALCSSSEGTILENIDSFPMTSMRAPRCGVATAPKSALSPLRPTAPTASSSTSSSSTTRPSSPLSPLLFSRAARVVPRSVAAPAGRLRCRAAAAATPNSLGVRLSAPGLGQSSPTVVYKFGGSSVADATRMREVADIVCSFPEHLPVIVLSAMGKVKRGRELVLLQEDWGREREREREGEREREKEKSKKKSSRSTAKKNLIPPPLPPPRPPPSFLALVSLRDPDPDLDLDLHTHKKKQKRRPLTSSSPPGERPSSRIRPLSPPWPRSGP